MTDSSDNNTNSAERASGLTFNSMIRTEAITVLCIILLLGGLYGYFFIDVHLEWAFEEGLSRSNGAQVDVRDVHTSFIYPSLTLTGVKFTNPRKPTHNIIEFGELSVSLPWTGLVRSKLLIEDVRLTELAYGTERAEPGYVRSEGGVIKELFQSIFKMALTKVEQTSKGTILENVFSLLEGTNLKQQLDEMKDQLKSPEKIKKIRANIDQLRNKWNHNLEQLPSKKELNEIRQKLEGLKKSKSDPTAMAGKLKEVQKTVDRLKNISERVEKFRNSFSSEFSTIKSQIQDLKQAVQEDREALRERIRLPSLDLENLSKKLFQSFLEQQVGTYTSLIGRARQYAPSGSGITAQSGARPRQEGVNFLFRTTSSYPTWWIKAGTFNAKIPSSIGGGNIQAELRDLSSNPVAVGDPSTISLSGALPNAPVRKFDGFLEMDHRGSTPIENFRIDLQELSIENLPLLNSDQYQFAIEKAIGSIKSSGTFKGSSLEATLNAQFDQPLFKTSSQVDWLSSVFESMTNSLTTISLDAEAQGALEDLSWSVKSNLGGVFANTLQNQVRGRVSQAKEDLLSNFNAQIGNQPGNLLGNATDIQSMVTRRLGSVDSSVEDLMDLASQKSGGFKDLLQGDGNGGDKKKDIPDSLKDKFNF